MENKDRKRKSSDRIVSQLINRRLMTILCVMYFKHAMI